jgi:hypothetical protein
MGIVIGVSGKARHGKDSVYAIARRCLGDGRVTRIGFADAVRDEARSQGWDGEKDDAGRELLQRIGMLRRIEDADYWVKKLLVQVHRASRDVVIITDVRFRNEAEALRNIPSSELWRVRRFTPGGLPFDNGLPQEQKYHPSETELDTYRRFDRYIDASDLGELRQKVEWILEHLERERRL